MIRPNAQFQNLHILPIAKPSHVLLNLLLHASRQYSKGVLRYPHQMVGTLVNDVSKSSVFTALLRHNDKLRHSLPSITTVLDGGFPR